MKSVAQICIHSSQFPENVQRDLLTSLRTRRVNHKFHYDSVKQTRKWLALHEAHSPARYDSEVLATYDRAFAETAGCIKSRRIHLVGLGCGGGQKDVQLLKRLQARDKNISYTPCDVSTAMVLVARRVALALLPPEKCFPFVCDLATASDLPETLLCQGKSRAARLLTFFGMIPNFEPNRILPKLAALVGRNDYLLFSANLAPGDDYDVGMKQILPQYDNTLTREWLSAFLFDLGVEPRDGRLHFAVETGGLGLKRIVVRFQFHRGRNISVAGQDVAFTRGEAIRLFFSYRYTMDRAETLLSRHGLKVHRQRTSSSGEEGVFLCCKQ